MSMVVVLPAPLGPRKATISPGSMVRSRPSTAVTAPKRLVRPRSAMAGTAPPGATPGAALVGAESVMPTASAPACPTSSVSGHDSPMTGVTAAVSAPKPRSADGEARLQIVDDRGEADALLAHRVALPHGH